MGILNSLSRLWMPTLLVLLGLMAFSASGGVALASDEEGDQRGVGKNADREAYCAEASRDNPTDCGSFCFWAICLECPQCCDGECDCNISGEHA